MRQSLAGNVSELLTITEDVYSYKSFKGEARYKHKQGIVLAARVHPGETEGSHMLRGFVEFLLSADPQAEALRKAFVLKSRKTIVVRCSEWT